MAALPSDEECLKLFLECGIEEKLAKETLKNANIKKNLWAVLSEAKSIQTIDKKTVNLLYLVASTLAPQALKHRSRLISYIVGGKITKINFNASLAFLKEVGEGDLDVGEFEKRCGVGVVITPEEIKKAVAAKIDSVKPQLLEQRYTFPINSILSSLREDALKWADQGAVKVEVDAQLLALLGEKDKTPVKKAKAPAKAAAASATPASGASVAPVVKELITFPDPKDNKQKRPELLENHLKFTGGRVFCRFPPEPNGYLHLGHAKSCNLNFSYPKKSGGVTYLRFDDTNPEAEKQEYFESIVADVEWLGHKPWKITWSSDYFDQLLELAVKLIKAGKAYVDHQTPEEIAKFREEKKDSPWRNRSIEENLREFENMKKGKYDEGAATLRMKMDMQSPNPVMRDLIAYRIKYTAHPHAGDKYCVWPSYDYTHCIVDSLENISHSLCTLEFLPRRESYYRLLDDLDLYKPLVWEYSRLNVTHVVLSKRRLIKLVQGGYVRGWDDPRMPTIRGLRRRGYTAAAINDFCDRIGITRNENLIEYELLENCVREDLDLVDRAQAVLEPLKVTLINYEDSHPKEVQIPNYPKDPTRGTHPAPFSKVLYIEKSDFRLQDIPGYKRLAPNKEVGLLHAGCSITCTDVVKDDNGNVIELKCSVNWKPGKQKGYINWVACPAPGVEPVAAEFRLYDHLFKSKVPQALEEWLEDLNPDSLRIHHGFIEPWAKQKKVGERVQLERIAYFVVDPDTTAEKMVWNRIVTLRENKWEKEHKDD